jgi:MFS family permease
MQENKLVGYSWAIFALVLATRTVATGLGWTCIPPFFNAIASEMKLTVMQIGMAWGMITLGALLFSLIGGLISDRIGIRWAGFLGLTLLAFGGALRGVAATYGEFLAAMFVFGGALGLTGPNFPRALSQWFPPERLGMVNGITMTGYGLGAALAMVISVRPKASATPSRPMPSWTPSQVRNLAAMTALPQPPSTSQKVPMNSAPSFFIPASFARRAPPRTGRGAARPRGPGPCTA